jgi:hypothetical protein
MEYVLLHGLDIAVEVDAKSVRDEQLPIYGFG